MSPPHPYVQQGELYRASSLTELRPTYVNLHSAKMVLRECQLVLNILQKKKNSGSLPLTATAQVVVKLVGVFPKSGLSLKKWPTKRKTKLPQDF